MDVGKKKDVGRPVFEVSKRSCTNYVVGRGYIYPPRNDYGDFTIVSKNSWSCFIQCYVGGGIPPTHYVVCARSLTKIWAKFPYSFFLGILYFSPTFLNFTSFCLLLLIFYTISAKFYFLNAFTVLQQNFFLYHLFLKRIKGERPSNSIMG